jgi:N-methylhydantoinase A/oxoprolinase/acetone carboxylase beta subunit
MEAAEAICKIADGTMQAALATTMATRGADPKSHVLFGYGGAGPSHCAGYTAGIDFGKIVIPSFAAVFSAFGASTADVRHRYEATSFVRFSNLPYDPVSLRFELDKITSLSNLPSEMVDRFNSMFRTLDESADEDMEAEGFNKQAVRKDYEMLARYAGQLWELRCPIPVNRVSSVGDFRAIVKAFEDKYEDVYTREAMAPSGGIEIIGIAVEAIGETVKPNLVNWELGGKDSNKAVKEERDVYFDGKLWSSKIYEAAKMEPGNMVEGPCIIEQVDTTVVVPPDRRVVVDRYRNFVLEPR